METKDAPREEDRRRFLKQLGTAAAGVAGGASFFPRPDDGVAHAAAARSDASRASSAYQVRLHAAQYQRNLPSSSHPSNGDEQTYPNFIGCYSKALPHYPNGEVEPAAFAALVHAMETGEPADFAAIPLGGTTRLGNPQGAFAFDFIGADSNALTLRMAPAFNSAEAAGEMVELYWLALTRDVPFASYSFDPAIGTAAASLSALTDFRGAKVGGAVTPASIFRGTTPGELTGPYISQFLYKDVPQGPYVQVQKVREASSAVDYMTDYNVWLGIQNGGAAGAKSYNGSNRRYIATGRDLAEYVHRDYTYQAFLNAALMLLAGGAAALSDANPYKAAGNQGGFTTFGPAQILDCVATVANLGLHAAWFQKWSVHRRVRPEAFAGCVHNKLIHQAAYPIHTDLTASNVLPAVIAAHGTYLLPMAYPEGSPTHPAYPAGHAAIAGACATLLKAFFKETNTIASPVEADATGTSLVGYGGTLTVGGELNKLAANIWRTDGVEGMNLGERVAIQYLRDLRRSYNESFDGFTFTTFDGTSITT